MAKHYLSDKEGFERTARYWTKTYADGSQSARPPAKGGSGQVVTTAQSSESTTSNAAEAEARRKKEEAEDPILKAGLKKEHVQQFVGMGFEQDKVIEVLKRLNYRGAK